MRFHVEIFVEQHSQIANNIHWFNGVIPDGEAFHGSRYFLKIDGRAEEHTLRLLRVQLQSLENSPNIPGRISREWFELGYNDETRAAGTHRQFLQFFQMFRGGMVERSHPQFPEIRCWANGVQLQGPPITINLIFWRETSKKMSESGGAGIFIFELERIRCPPPPRKVNSFFI